MSRRQILSKDFQMILDGLLLGFCLWLSHLLRVSGFVRLETLGSIPEFSESFWVLLTVIAVSPVLLDLSGFYSNQLTERMEVLIGKIGKAALWLVLVISLIASFARLQIPSRSVVIIFLIISPITLLLRTLITRKIIINRYKMGAAGERSVIVGTSKDTGNFLAGLSSWERLELQITRQLDLAKHDRKSILRHIHDDAAGRVIFVTSESSQIGNLPMECEDEGMDVWITTNGFFGIQGNPVFHQVGKTRVMSFHRTADDFWYSFFKRLIDIVGASFGILILLPIGLLIALATKLTSPGPVIFRQVRSGKRGKRFTILKFRSMVANAPEIHADLAHQNEMKGPVFKIKNDPRVTPLGSFLRASSLDELPQLLNVLAGEMSIVGPRPLPDYETEQIEKSAHRRRLSVKPGLTCLWQISGRNSITNFEDWVQLDLDYIERAGIILDLWIILRTIPIVFFRIGAH